MGFYSFLCCDDFITSKPIIIRFGLCRLSFPHTWHSGAQWEVEESAVPDLAQLESHCWVLITVTVFQQNSSYTFRMQGGFVGWTWWDPQMPASGGLTAGYDWLSNLSHLRRGENSEQVLPFPHAGSTSLSNATFEQNLRPRVSVSSRWQVCLDWGLGCWDCFGPVASDLGLELRLQITSLFPQEATQVPGFPVCAVRLEAQESWV